MYRKKNRITCTAAVLTITSFLLFFITGCTEKRYTYGIAHTPAISKDGKLFACIVAEIEEFTYQENGGYRKTNYSTTYWLKQYETATGKLTTKKKLVSSSEADNVDINCFGCFDNEIWLYVNGIRAYDMNSLEEITNEAKIAAANGMKKTIFPYGERLVYPAVEKGHIDFIADDGEQYRLLLKDLQIINKKNLQATEEKNQKSINRMLHKDEYGVRCDTFSNNMFALAKDEARAIDSRPGVGDLSETNYRMKLFKSAYTLQRLGLYNSFTFQNITEASNTTYLNPCFAKNTYTDEVIHLSNPNGYIIIHQDTVGEKSKALITRIDINNKKIWEAASGVSTKISECIMAGKYLIITTNQDYMLSPHIGKDALCIVDTETGGIIKPALNL